MYCLVDIVNIPNETTLIYLKFRETEREERLPVSKQMKLARIFVVAMGAQGSVGKICINP